MSHSLLTENPGVSKQNLKERIEMCLKDKCILKISSLKVFSKFAFFYFSCLATLYRFIFWHGALLPFNMK